MTPPDTRPTSAKDEIDRTGRDAEVTGRDVGTGESPEFGEPGAVGEQPPERLENGFA